MAKGGAALLRRCLEDDRADHEGYGRDNPIFLLHVLDEIHLLLLCRLPCQAPSVGGPNRIMIANQCFVYRSGQCLENQLIPRTRQ